MKTKEKIMATALELFDRQGLDATSVADICEVADVSNGSFFHAFPRREKLFTELFFAALNDYHAAMEGAVSSGDTAMAGIAALVTTHVQWVVSSPVQARFLFEHAKAEWMDDDDIRRFQEAENTRFADALDEWRLAMVKRGMVIDVDRKIFIAQIIGPAQIFCRSWLSGRSQGSPLDVCDDLIASAQRALGAK